MVDKTEELIKGNKEIFDYKETPVVSLPQFVIDRIKPCVSAFEDGLTLEGAILFVNGKDSQNHPVDGSNGLPTGLPEITPEFEE